MTILPASGSTGTCLKDLKGIATTTMSAASAAAVAVDARARAPSAPTSPASVLGPRLLLITTLWPTAIARWAIACPMLPLPMNPIVAMGAPSVLWTDRSCSPRVRHDPRIDRLGFRVQAVEDSQTLRRGFCTDQNLVVLGFYLSLFGEPAYNEPKIATPHINDSRRWTIGQESPTLGYFQRRESCALRSRLPRFRDYAGHIRGSNWRRHSPGATPIERRNARLNAVSVS